MPIVLPTDIPAFKTLADENVFVMPKNRAMTQDIRPIEIAIVNLMPTKIDTETQLSRLLANTPLQVNLTLIHTATHTSKNTEPSHMEKFYKTIGEVANKKFDGVIVTGAPVETLPYDAVDYWNELVEILDFAKQNATSTLFICWGAQAALYRYFGIGKQKLPKKMFGVFKNRSFCQFEPLLKGLNDEIYIPHSRHTKIDEEAVKAHKGLTVLAAGEECGLSIVKSNDDRLFFFFGHSEYDRGTLAKEYFRDVAKGLDIDPPHNYFTDEKKDNINMSWISTANLLFYNWLNYYVYQVTPYQLIEN
jgi:homoserine O-succinyltransferase